MHRIRRVIGALYTVGAVLVLWTTVKLWYHGARTGGWVLLAVLTVAGCWAVTYWWIPRRIAMLRALLERTRTRITELEAKR